MVEGGDLSGNRWDARAMLQRSMCSPPAQPCKEDSHDRVLRPSTPRVCMGAEATAVAAVNEHGITAVEQLPTGPTGPEGEEN
jgi:hypothetical protein